MPYLFDGINHPTVQQVQAAGAAGCLMYGGTPGDGLGKDFTVPQYSSYKAAGLLTAFVYENSANDMGTGMAGGAAHADTLLADLHSKGVLSTEPIGVTVDEHVTAANIPLAVQYQTGFYQRAIALGWAGARGGYGFSEFLIAIHDAGVADWFWGAGTRSSLPSYTNIWQDNTGTINVGGSADDRDWILVPLPTGGQVTTPTDFLAANLAGWNGLEMDEKTPMVVGEVLAMLGVTLANGDPQHVPPPGTLLGTPREPTLFGRFDRLEKQLATLVSGVDTDVKSAQAQEGADHAAAMGALAKEETDLLGAIKALPAPVVQQIVADPAAVAADLESAGLPTQIISALLALLAKAAPTGGTA